MKRPLSEKAYREACEHIPGGVNSPVRALRGLGEAPLFVEKAKDAVLTDIDGNRYTDFCLSWGVFLAGHARREVVEAAARALAEGSSYGIPTRLETSLAAAVRDFFPSIEKIRFVSSGTEAVMSAVRVARGFTGRDLVVKFDGCYHGHADHLLVSAGSGVAGLSGSSSAGVPEAFSGCTVSLPFNDPGAVEEFFLARGGEIAALIVEPVPANMGVVPPQEGFLEFLREVTRRNGTLLIFDEVITGFRLAPGGAQEVYGIRPDLTTLGKIVGGGFPAAAFGGRADAMELLAPDGPVYQAGTLSGNPVAMAAGLETLRILAKEGFYGELERKSLEFTGRLAGIVEENGFRLNRSGSLFTVFFTPEPVRSFADALRSDTEKFARFFRELLRNGIYFSPSQFEAGFLSAAHTEQQLGHFLDTVERILGMVSDTKK